MSKKANYITHKAVNKENTACAEPLAKAEADVALIQQKVILSVRTRNNYCFNKLITALKLLRKA